MKKKFKLNCILLAMFTGIGMGYAHADVTGITIHANTDGTNDTEWLALRSGNGGGGTGGSSASIDIQSSGTVDVRALSTINITGNTDSGGASEGVFLRSNGGNNPASYLDIGSDGIASLGSTTVNINSATTNIGTGGNTINMGRAQSTNNITGTTNSAGTFTQVGTANINATGGGATNIGSASSTNTVLGTTNITGTTSINNSGSLNTTIGNAANTTTIQSGTNIITGANNSMLATGANTITAVSNNNISAATNNLTASTANNIQGPLNNIGTSSSSDNYIGNTLSGTKVTATAGNARQALTNGSANTTVTAGTSGLTARVGKPNVATTGQVLLSNTGGTTVDANGKILVSTATAYVSPTAATAAMTLTNGYGNTHGLVVTESQTTLSGGTESSSMTLSDRAATFSNAQTGAPITVTGVADGRADFDAVNVRQFAGAIAAVAAQANIPALAAGQDRTFGVGMGNFMGKSALALGMSMRGNNNSVYKATMSTGLNSGMQQTVIGVGGAWGF